MEAASIVFRKINSHYSHLLLHHAQQLFEFRDKYRGSYYTSIGDVKSYYASVSGYRDELLWAALWLQKATGEEEEERNKYLEYVIDKAHCFGGIGWAITEFSWDVKFAGVQVLAAKDFVRDGSYNQQEIDEVRENLASYIMYNWM